MEVQRLVTAGNHDPAGPPVHENNVWIVGEGDDVVVIDPAHDAAAVARSVAGRRVTAILLTHGHWDHVRAAVEFAALVGAPVHLNEADRFLWAAEHGETPFEPLRDGDVFHAGGVVLVARHTPGHTPGSTSFVAAAAGPQPRGSRSRPGREGADPGTFPRIAGRECCVFSGDTLFEGGPGATRWDYSSFEQIIESISSRLFTLPDETVVYTGHGPSTSIGAERPALQEWVRRGW
ncbi:MAG TPA: MBL fold metallo-hydrolase [Arachnia sp.]|nr:MBL fold metallo-hydrolase [Arachnia sp.]